MHNFMHNLFTYLCNSKSKNSDQFNSCIMYQEKNGFDGGLSNKITMITKVSEL